MKNLLLFLIIFFAVYFANLASHFTQTYLWVEALKVFTSDLISSSKHNQVNSKSLQSDLNTLRTNPPAKPKPSPNMNSKKHDIELNNAFELCNFWSKAYSENLSERAEPNMKESCDAYNLLLKKGAKAP